MWESTEKFWDIVKDVWVNGYMGVDFSKIFLALFVLLLALLVRRAFSKVAMNRLKSIVTRTSNKFDDELIGSLEGPIRFIPIVVGVYFAFEFADLAPDGKASVFAGHLVRSLVVFTLFWSMVRIVDPLTFLVGHLEQLFSKEMVSFLVRVFKGILIGLGAATILEIWGIQVGPIIAGFGLIGVAVALGAQDLFKNLIGGFLILAEKRCHVGDWVLIQGVVEGTVEKIGFRSTLIRRFDKAPTVVPNATFSDHPVTNFSEMTYRRIYWKIGVEYGTSVAQLQKITSEIKRYLLENENFVAPSDASLFVVTDSFNDSSIDIMIYCFTKTKVWGEWLDIKQELAYKIKQIVEDAGTGFAFPSISLYAAGGADQPDIFVPPIGAAEKTLSSDSSHKGSEGGG